jgi:hypothetical protein
MPPYRTIPSNEEPKNVGTIHELSLPRVSDYAYLIFGNIYSLSSGIIGISVMI